MKNIHGTTKLDVIGLVTALIILSAVFIIQPNPDRAPYLEFHTDFKQQCKRETVGWDTCTTALKTELDIISDILDSVPEKDAASYFQHCADAHQLNNYKTFEFKATRECLQQIVK